jgi:hypothetical protein
MVERPCWLCSLTLSCKALREALTTGWGRPAFYCTVHKYPAQPHHTTVSGACLHYTPGPMTTHLDMTLTQTLKMKWTWRVLCHFRREALLAEGSCKGWLGSSGCFFFFL